MLKKLTLLTVILFSSCALAETCPTLQQIKDHQFQQVGWQAFDIDNGEPLDPDQLVRFEKQVRSFANAIWLSDAPEGTAQCHYHGSGSHFDLDVYLAKNLGEPDKTSGNWHNINDMWQCDISLLECRYT